MIMCKIDVYFSFHQIEGERRIYRDDAFDLLNVTLHKRRKH
jgi:hypothetical protein